MSKRRWWAFRVTDEDGLWGDTRFRAATEKEARAACRKHLQEDEVEPDGLLCEPFRLTLLPPALARQPRRVGGR